MGDALVVEVIDVFCHWLPREYVEAALARARRPLHMLERAAAIPAMTDPDARRAAMDEFEGYRQVPSLASPPIELVADAVSAPELARIANDAQARSVAAEPERYLGFVAAVAMNNPDGAVAEAERAVKTLGAAGVQVFTNVNGRPLDEPRYGPLFELMAELDRPLWLHPARGMDRPDYLVEDVSKLELWWALGWPYETSLAMARLAFAALFDRWPEIKIITHHAGGMIPVTAGRFEMGMTTLLGTRTPQAHAEAVRTELAEPPAQALRRFYADTATFGCRAGIEAALAFFGVDHLLFGSDMPFDATGGPGYVRATLATLERMSVNDQHRGQILRGNAARILKLETSESTR